MARGIAARSLAFAFVTSVFGWTLSDIRRELPISINFGTSAISIYSREGGAGTHNSVQRALQNV
jgi:hypothetical protein